MYGNDFFNQRDDRHRQGPLRDQGGSSGQRHVNQNGNSQMNSSFGIENWNGLSPRNRENQSHYQRIRESPAFSDGEEWLASDIEPPLTRKRLGSPIATNNYPAKRKNGYDKALADQRFIPPPSARNASYCSNEYNSPPPVEHNKKRSSWIGPKIIGGEKWGCIEESGYEQPALSQMPNRQDNHGQLFDEHRRHERFTINGSGDADCRRVQRATPNTLRDSPFSHKGTSVAPGTNGYPPYQQKQMTVVPDGRGGRGRQRFVDLTTPESANGRRMTGHKSTNSSSSTLRGVTETEPTDLGNESDWDIQDMKEPVVQPYVPRAVNGAYNGPSVPCSGVRSQNVVARGQNSRPPSRLGQESHPGSHGNNTFSNSSVRREPYNVPRVHNFASALKAEDSQSRTNQSGASSRQGMSSNGYRESVYASQNHIGGEDYPESDDNETLEYTMRKQAWLRNRKAAGDRSTRDTLSACAGYSGTKHGPSGYSSLEAEASKFREVAQQNTLSRIRGADTSKMNGQSISHDMKTPVDRDGSRNVITKQTAAQATRALEKQNAEERRQMRALETIIQQEKRAKKLQEYDDLFEEAPVDEAASAHLRAKGLEKARKYKSEEASVIERHDRQLQESLAAIRKKRDDDREEKNAEKRNRIEEKRQQGKRLDDERLEAKRKLVTEVSRLRRMAGEEARVENPNKTEAEGQAAKKRAATLQSFKKAEVKFGSAVEAIQVKRPEVESSRNISDGGLFVSDEEGTPTGDEPPKEQPNKRSIITAGKEDVQKTDTTQKPEDVVFSEKSARVEGATTLEGQLNDESVEQPSMVNTGNASVSAVEKPLPATNQSTDKTDSKDSSASGPQTLAPRFGDASITSIASDGRRRPPETSRPRAARRTSPDLIRFTGGCYAAKDTPSCDRAAPTSTSHGSKESWKKRCGNEESQNQAKKVTIEDSQKNRAWDPRFRRPGDTPRQQDAGKHGRPLSPAGLSKRPPVSSQIDFVATVESHAKKTKKTEQDRRAKYEKDKAACRRRYEREIRTVLSGQGIEPDDEKISKQVDEKMVLWEENRRKKERKESGGKDIFTSLNQPDEQDSISPPTLSNTEEDESVKDPESQKEQQRAQSIRAGVEFLAAQNKAGNEFAKAASRARVQDFDSDESEEDPDDEPEVQVASATERAEESSEETDGMEVDETLNPTGLDASSIPPLPEAPEPPASKTAFLPDIVNPKEEDMMHSYSVRHRAERDSNIYESVLLKSFHSLEEANAFAQHKVSEFDLGPSSGKSETHDEDNLYIGKVIYDKINHHSETVWVTREIVYLGDVANIKRGDLKPIMVPKVYTVVQVLQQEDGSYVASVVAAASIKMLANKKAADRFLALSKPARPRLDSVALYDNEVVPLARKCVADAEAQDATLDIGGCIPDTERTFSIFVSENPVVGPLN